MKLHYMKDGLGVKLIDNKAVAFYVFGNKVLEMTLDEFNESHKAITKKTLSNKGDDTLEIQA